MSKSNSKNSVIIALVVTLVFILAIFAISNYATIFRTFYPPKPEIVSFKGDDSSTKLFEYSDILKVQVRNDGGDGNVVFEATVFQGNNHWTKSTREFIGSKETKEMDLQFDEVKLFGGRARAEYRVYPYGK